MKFIPVSEASVSLNDLIARTTKFNEIIGISGTAGNAILLSEDEYDAIRETLYIMHQEEVRQDILEAAAEDLEESIEEEDANW